MNKDTLAKLIDNLLINAFKYGVINAYKNISENLGMTFEIYLNCGVHQKLEELIDDYIDLWPSYYGVPHKLVNEALYDQLELKGEAIIEYVIEYLTEGDC